MEDKKEICRLLCRTLQATRNCRDLVAIEYDPDREQVTVFFWEGKKVINVAMDSGTAMIRDIMKHLGT